MRLNVHFRELTVSPAVRAATERTLRSALGLHSSRLLSARVILQPSPPMQGTGRCACRVRVRMRDGRSLVHEDHGDGPAEAAAAAAGRLTQRLELARRIPFVGRRDSVPRRHSA